MTRPTVRLAKRSNDRSEKIIDIDFEQFMPKNLKKAKMKRILAKRETPLQGARLQKDIKDSFENVLLPLGKADKGYLPKRMDLTFRRKMVHQVELLGKRKLCRDIQVTDVVPLPKNNFKRWNDDGRSIFQGKRLPILWSQFHTR